MDSSDLQLEKLKTQLADRDALLADRDATIDRLARDVAILERHLKSILDKRGRGTSGDDQTPLLPGLAPDDESTSVEEAAAEENDSVESGEPKGKRKKKKSKKVDTSGLPRDVRLHEVPVEDRFCPDTGLPLVPVGEKVFEELDFKRAEIRVIEHHQVIYGLAPEQAVDRQAAQVTAPMPPRPLENAAASSNLLAWLLVQKYQHHLPLYRQEQIFAREGLRLARQTLCDWVLGAAEALRPIANCLMDLIRAGPVMQLDDTPVKCQGGRGKKNFQAHLWTFANPEVIGIVFRFTLGRGSDLLAPILGDFSGFLVGDGYSGHPAAVKKVPGPITITGCYAHATRKFRDAESEAPGTARLFREDIKSLYAVEEEADSAAMSHEARCDLRRRKSRPIVASLLARARRLRHTYSDAGVMSKAITYLIRQRKPLRRFLDDGRVPLDNNACERAIRPVAIGRRNWLFAGSDRGGRAAAVVYSLIETCRLVGIDAAEYLADVLVRVATHPADDVRGLLPDRWAALVERDGHTQ